MFFRLSRGNWGRMIVGTGHVLDLEERFEVALRDTSKCWRQAVDRRLNRLGVSQASFMTIAAAAQARLPLSQSELADTLAISRASMVQTIDRLVQGGLVKRESAASDRRVKRIVITDAGTRLYSVLKEELAVIRRQFLANIEREKLVLLTELLEKLQGEIPPSPEHSMFASPKGSAAVGLPKHT
jgi:MarR family transcriptional regulator, transcriptional regulator for hemolysin